MKLSINDQEMKEYFAGLKQFLQQKDRGCSHKPFWEVVESYRNQFVLIGTEAGGIQGKLVEVGKDYAEIEEFGGTQVILSVQQIVSIQAI